MLISIERVDNYVESFGRQFFLENFVEEFGGESV